MSKEEYQHYEAERKAYLDNNAVLHYAQLEGKIEIARNLKKKGLDTTLIAETTGLSPEEIEQLD